jgi:hypothetical protein
MQGLSLEDQLLNGNAKRIDLDDDIIFDFEMNAFEIYANDDHELILWSEQMYVEVLMDQRLDDLIWEEAPT